MLTCPHCGNEVMTLAQKAYLAPTQTVTCQSCGRDVGLARIPMLLALSPIVIGIVLALVLHFSIEVGGLGGGLVAIVAYVFLVPFVKRE